MEQNPSWEASNLLGSQEMYPPCMESEDPVCSPGGVHHWAVSWARCIVESFCYYPPLCAWIVHMYCFIQVLQLQFFNYLTFCHFTQNIYKIPWVAH